ncbi:acetyltransferase [Staphylococcus microti]|uniref:Acetyltransferase n=1 Tax=Staphylococcus microti TaxID=569857 RepID=A0A0D6XQM3_9STAP|nr:GNAT family N-acetyltransferase [Staphylococcus microti]KIX91124.1 acetyltransferase [Staphylococcus microti]PNZ79776.1 N-acetyltransferase [Staphylococcus microti]SUM58212.1 GNAT family acetyltransferase [Staphylococcus microti]
MHITTNEIYVDGTLFEEDARVKCYRTPTRPLKYDGNKWRYKKLPDLLMFKSDMMQQRQMHEAQGSTHLNFEFPQDVKLPVEMLQFLRAEGFTLGCVELYAIEAIQLRQLTDQMIDMQRVTLETLKDYFEVFGPMSLEYGEAYITETEKYMQSVLDDPQHAVHYYVAYEAGQPVGVMNVIPSDDFVELDGFAVLSQYQKRGIGTRMQAAVGHIAQDRPVILVADAEDTAKDMYVKQGYSYLGFQYSALRE